MTDRSTRDDPVRSDEDIERSRVVPLAPHNRPVELAPADPAWAAAYAVEAERIRAALGDRAIRVEHTGSTSVPGLAAKPIIDITLAVADSASEADYVPDLEAVGYVLAIREPDWYEHRMFRRGDPKVQVHVFTAGSPEIDRMVMFRDRLRMHDDERELYEQTKRDLAARTWRHIQHYADAKTEVVEAILRRAGAPPPLRVD